MKLFSLKRFKKKAAETPREPKPSLGSGAVPAPPDTLDYRLDPWAFYLQYHERYSEVAELKKSALKAINELEDLDNKRYSGPRLRRQGDIGLSTVRRHLRHLTLHELPHFSARVEDFHKELLAQDWGPEHCSGDRLTSVIKRLSVAIKDAYPLRDPEFLKHLRNFYEAEWLLEFKNEHVQTEWFHDEEDGFAEVRYLMADLALGEEAPAEAWLSALTVLRKHYEGKLTQESEASILELLDSAEIFFLLR